MHMHTHTHTHTHTLAHTHAHAHAHTHTHTHMDTPYSVMNKWMVNNIKSTLRVCVLPPIHMHCTMHTCSPPHYHCIVPPAKVGNFNDKPICLYMWPRIK